MRIFHIAEADAWARRTDLYVTDTLETEGFIHCSTEHQLAQVAARFYAGRDDLVLITIDPDALGATLVHEDLYDMGEDFPHIYGPIPLSAVVDTVPFAVS